MINSDWVPTSEDWLAVQGGEPRIFRSPTGLSYQLVHYYGAVATNPELRKLPHFGVIVPTIGTNLHDSLAKPTVKSFINNQLSVPRVRSVAFPAVLLAEHHGLACENRSAISGAQNSSYDRITDEMGLARFIETYTVAGFTEQVMSVDPNSDGYRLLPLVRVEDLA